MALKNIDGLTTEAELEMRLLQPEIYSYIQRPDTSGTVIKLNGYYVLLTVRHRADNRQVVRPVYEIPNTPTDILDLAERICWWLEDWWPQAKSMSVFFREYDYTIVTTEEHGANYDSWRPDRIGTVKTPSGKVEILADRLIDGYASRLRFVGSKSDVEWIKALHKQYFQHNNSRHFINHLALERKWELK